MVGQSNFSKKTLGKQGKRASTHAKKTTSKTPAKRKTFKGSVEHATPKQIDSITKDLKKLAENYPDVDFQIKIKRGKKTSSIEHKK